MEIKLIAPFLHLGTVLPSSFHFLLFDSTLILHNKGAFPFHSVPALRQDRGERMDMEERERGREWME